MAKIVVGLDFGTTFSGFAFAHGSDPDHVYTFYDYPKAGGSEKPYCKTLTASYYRRDPGSGSWAFQSWGYSARADSERDAAAARRVKAPPVGAYFTNFKLHLAARTKQEVLPDVNTLITDYLRELGALVVARLQGHFGEHVTKQSIQWCVTVPSIWDNVAKAAMRACMAAAGLADPHPLLMALEPEAASVFCHKLMSLRAGDRVLVADIGGGTADLVVQEVVAVAPRCKVREVTPSSGGFCGGTHLDARFWQFLHRTIPSLQDSIDAQPSILSQLVPIWEHMKAAFGEPSIPPIEINLPVKVVRRWEDYDREHNLPRRESYDEIELSDDEIRSIFDPVVDQNLDLISHQLTLAGSVTALVVVGGFAGSPYLMSRIRDRFGSRIPQIITPPNPGSAVCQGAVMLALNPDAVLSRICRKTLGIEFHPSFDPDLDLPQYRYRRRGGHTFKCTKRFRVYVHRGDAVEVDSCISHVFATSQRGQRTMPVRLFSSDEREPRYTDDAGVRKEAEILIDLGNLHKADQHRVKVSLFFGRASMDVKAEVLGSDSTVPQQVELPVEVEFC